MVAVFLFLSGALTICGLILNAVISVAYVVKNDLDMAEEHDVTARKVNSALKLGVLALFILSWFLANPGDMGSIITAYTFYVWIWLILGVCMCLFTIVCFAKKTSSIIVKSCASFAAWNIVFGLLLSVLCWLIGG